MAATAPTIENLSLSINLETRVRASLDTSFAALLEQLGSGFDNHEGKPMPMKLETWPGGRWFRELGGGDGHLWGHVQAIKRPTLLEIYGPLFMSYAVVSNVQYRLSEVEGGTLIAFHHFALGAIPDDYRQNIDKGWTHIGNRIRERAEGNL
ncbi:MAG TPA: SRPBCC domain-containing protein [Candidatus Acidoferrales bacterium]|nr:SRPBCC domain-containing protein [Candidatus Acidoferrales bacterium]